MSFVVKDVNSAIHFHQPPPLVSCTTNQVANTVIHVTALNVMEKKITTKRLKTKNFGHLHFGRFNFGRFNFGQKLP